MAAVCYEKAFSPEPGKELTAFECRARERYYVAGLLHQRFARQGAFFGCWLIVGAADADAVEGALAFAVHKRLCFVEGQLFAVPNFAVLYASAELYLYVVSVSRMGMLMSLG